MAVTKEKKEEILQGLIESLKSAKSVVFSHYSGLDVKSMQELRTSLRDKNSEYKVAKKTLIKLAAKEAGLPELPNEVLDGPIGIAISFDDELSAAKAIYDFSKTHKEAVLIGAIIDGEILSKEEVNEFAKIPSREELYAKLVYTIKSPISGFYSTLHGVLRNFVGVLNAYKDSKPAEEAPKEEPKTEAPAPEAKEKAKEEVKADEATAPDAKTDEPKAEEKTEEATPAPDAKADKPKAEEKAEDTAPAPEAEEKAPADEETKTDEPATDAAKTEEEGEAAPEAEKADDEKAPDAPTDDKPAEEAKAEEPAPEAATKDAPAEESAEAPEPAAEEDSKPEEEAK